MDRDIVTSKLMLVVKLCRAISNNRYIAHMSYTGGCDVLCVYVTDEEDGSNTIAWANMQLPDMDGSRFSTIRFEAVLYNLECMLTNNEHFKTLPLCTWTTAHGIKPYDLERMPEVLDEI